MENVAPRYLWIIKFSQNEETSPFQSRPFSADMFIPSPPGAKEKWQQVDNTLERDAYDFLAFIQNLCEEIHKECVKREEQTRGEPQTEENKQNVEKTSQSLRNLENILARFNEIMKRLNKPPPSPQ